MRNRNQITIDGVWVATGHGLFLLCSFLLNIMLARLLSSANMGKYFLIASLTNTLSLIASCGLGQLAVKEIAGCLGVGNESRAGQIVGGIFRCTLLGCGGIALLILGLGSLAKVPASLVLITAGWMAIKTWQNLLIDVLRGFHDIRAATVYGNVLTYVVVTGFVAIDWLCYRHADLTTALLLLMGGWGIAGLLTGWAVRRKLTMPLSSPVSIRLLLSQGWPVLSNSLLWLLLTQADLWILTLFRPTSEVALYGVISRTATLISVPEGIAQKTLSPKIAELHVQGRLSELESMLRTAATWASIPSLSLLVVYVLAAKPLLGIFYGEYYRNGVTGLIVLGVGQMINVGSGLCGTTMIMTGHQRSLLTISTLCSLLAATLALILARPYGVLGVASATGIGFAVQAASMLFFVKLRMGIWTHFRVRPGVPKGSKI
jgi:O-antigen/teichoic acid export membrane protein